MNKPTVQNDPTVARCPGCGRPAFLTWTFIAQLIDDAFEVAREDVLDDLHRNRKVVPTGQKPRRRRRSATNGVDLDYVLGEGSHAG